MSCPHDDEAWPTIIARLNLQRNFVTFASLIDKLVFFPT